MAEYFDIIIVGSGAGGGTLAHTLAPTGKRILILERGDFLPREFGNWDPSQVLGAGRYVSSETWYDAHGRPFQPAVHYFVGGATKLYGAALGRLRPMDFGSVRHMDGASPAWPFSYTDFEPWYTRAEWLYLVHGLHGEDRTEGAWSEEYLWPPVSHEPTTAQLADELTLAGYQPFHMPTGVLLDAGSRAVSGCIRCGTCDGFPCLLHAKADADIVAVRPLLGLLNVTLLVGAEVTRLETDSQGRSVTGVVVDRGGSREVYRGGIVVLAAGAVNSARILLRSASDVHPGGLANGSGQVGRNLMRHNYTDVVAVANEPVQAVFRETLGINDFYLGGRHGKWPLGSIQLRADTHESSLDRGGSAAASWPRHLGRFQDAGRAIGFRLTTEDLPRPGNRVTVDGQGRVRLAHRPTGDGAARLLYRNLRSMLAKTKMIGGETLDRPARPARSARTRRADYAGTCRMGADPATSVLDGNCRAHELDNLYVVDASFFPSIGAMSPALSVMANAIRVGEHLAARLGCWTPPRGRALPRQPRPQAAGPASQASSDLVATELGR